jgi:hypothetical protein
MLLKSRRELSLANAMVWSDWYGLIGLGGLMKGDSKNPIQILPLKASKCIKKYD